jgi:hypothetical protein
MHSVIGIEAFDQSQVHGKVPQQPTLPHFAWFLFCCGSRGGESGFQLMWFPAA